MMFTGTWSYVKFIRSIRWDSNQFLSGRLNRKCMIFRNVSRYQNMCMCQLKTTKLLSPTRKVALGDHPKTYTVNSDTKCWNCNKNLEILKFSCLNCGVLQRPNPDMTYFDLMDLPPNFDLDPDEISTKYKALQMMFHPDKYVRRSKEEIDISDDYSKLVNKAYTTLRNPLTRGMYILNLNGVPTDDDSVKMNQEFLIEVLERNEELENVNDVKSLQELSKINSSAITDFVTKASKAFALKDLYSAREILMKLKYFVNIENEIKKKKSVLGVVD